MMTSRMRAAFKAGMVLGLLAPASVVYASGITVPELVVFGDSLSDTGNAAFGTGGLLPGPATNYTTGRFTDGPETSPSTTAPLGIWVDQFSARRGITDPQPGFAVPGGTNFAVGNASTGTNPNFPGLLQSPGTDQQVQAYLGAAGGQVSSSALYSFWAGANDIKGNPSPATATQAADNIYQNILTLSGAGAKNFMWFDLPTLGALPGVRADGPLAIAAADAASAAFNSEWQKDLYLLSGSGILVTAVDVQSLFNQVLSQNAAGCTPGAGNPYCFANVTDPAQGTSADPNTYLFWDGQHPTTAGQALVADLVSSDIDAVPEPANLAAIGVAILCVVLAFTRSRRAQRAS